MKRFALRAIPILLVLAAMLAATSAVAAPLQQGCNGHGYSHGHCVGIQPGQTGTTSPPGIPVTISFTDPYNFPVNIGAADVATPAGAPAGSECFSVQVFNADTGQAISGTLSNPLVFSSSGTVFAFNSSTGTYTAVSESSSGGVFCFVSSSPNITLPATGGAAGA